MDLAAGITQEDLKLFLQEADEQLQTLDEDIIRLEKESNNPDLMQEIFRAVHTLKGSSAMVGHQRLSDIAHAMENVLDQVRKGLMAASPAIIDALLHGLDVIRLLRQEMVSPDTKPVDINDAVAELSALLKTKKKSSKKNVGRPVALTLTDEEKVRLEEACKDGKKAFLIKVSFDKKSSWIAVRSFQVINNLSAIANIIISSPNSQEIEEGKVSYLFQAIIASSNSKEDIKKMLDGISETENIEISIYEKEQSAEVSQTTSADITASGKDDNKLSQTVRVDINRLDTLMLSHFLSLYSLLSYPSCSITQ